MEEISDHAPEPHLLVFETIKKTTTVKKKKTENVVAVELI
jgi:hypothetical protein